MVEVSVIIPTKNEEKTIGVCIDKVKKIFRDYGIDGEIIVSDSSTDRTPEIAREKGAIVVKPDKMGYGYAYLYAFKFARGKYIVIGDADNTYDFLEMPKLLEPLRRGKADLVIGSRFKGKILPGAMPWLHKYVGNPLLTRILNILFKANVSDAHSGFRAFTRDALEKMELRCHGMEFASEMIIEAVRRGLRIEEVPITYHPREGESKLNSFSDGWRHLRFMLLQTPKYLFYLPGIFMFAIGLPMIVAMAITPVTIFGIHLGIHSMIAFSLLTLTGYQLIFIGLFSAIYARDMGLVEYDGITRKITRLMSLERGLLLGIFLTSLGFFYILLLIREWVNSGFRHLPMLNQDIFGFTIFILGLQTIFFSFFLSFAIENGQKKSTPSMI